MWAKTTPEVPSVQETMPASTMPLPTALEAWSPPPPTTGVPATSPVSGGGLLRDLARDFDRFVAGGEDRAIEPQGVHHLEGPAAVDDVEDGRAGGVGDFGGELAGEAEAHVVLGQEHFAHALEVPRLVIADPQQFGQGEAGEHGVGDVLKNLVAAELGVDGVHLRLAALVAPDEGGPDDGVGTVEDHETVHLAGESDAVDVTAGDARGGKHGANGDDGRVPPVLGTLLRPEGPLHADVFVRGGCAARTAPRWSTRMARVLPVPISMPSHI